MHAEARSHIDFQIAPEALQGYSYRELYDIDAEIELPIINSNNRLHYLERSIIHTFDEHFARLKFGDGVDGFLLNDGRAEFLGVDMTASWARTAEIDGYGSRNWLESMGYLRAIELLRDPLCERVVISSPKKDDVRDRRYIMVLEKQPQREGVSDSEDIPIEQYTIMVGGDRLGFSHAQLECHALCDVAGISEENRPAFANPAEVLVTPIPMPYGSKHKVFDIAGIEVADIVQAKLYHDNIEKYFGDKIRELSHLIVQIRENPDDQILRNEAEKLRDVLFKNVDEHTLWLLGKERTRSVALESIQRMSPTAFADTRRSYTDEQLRYHGERPCPTAKKKKIASVLQKGGSLFSTGAMSAMEARMDPNLCRCILHAEPHFHCEGLDKKCNHPIPVGHGITTCSACGAGKVC